MQLKNEGQDAGKARGDISDRYDLIMSDKPDPKKLKGKLYT